MTAKEIRSKINKLLIEQQTIALAGFNTESRAAFNKMQQEVESLEAAFQIEERLADGRSFERSARPNSNGVGNEHRAQLNAAFRSYGQTGQIHAEYRDLLTTSDATGGALIPEEFFPELTNAQKAYGPIATLVKQRITDGTGRPLKISLGNDTANGIKLLGTEGTSAPAETDPIFSSKILGSDTVTGGLIKVSFQEFNDSSFDLGKLIEDYFGMRYARGIELALTKGVDGAGTALPNFPVGGMISAASVGTTTASVSALIGWDDLTAAYGALDPAYITNAVWQMNSTTRATLLGLKDGFGRPFFMPNPTTGEPFGFLMGSPVVLNQSLDSIAANKQPILFGDPAKSILFRTDGAPSLLRLNERFADTLEIGFYLWSRVGSATIIPAGANPLTSIKIAAS